MFTAGDKVALQFNDPDWFLGDFPPLGTVGVVDSVGPSGCPGDLFTDTVWVSFPGCELICECDPEWLRAA